MKRQPLVIQNATLVPMAETRVITPGFLITDETGKIAALGKMSNLPVISPEARVLDAAGCIVLPGLIDTHYHSSQQLERGIFARISAMKYPGWAWYLVGWESRLTKEALRLSAQAAAVNAIQVGTTFLAEHGGRYPHILAQVLEEVGIRGMVAASTMDMDPVTGVIPANMLLSTNEALAVGEEIVRRYPYHGDGLARGVLSLRQILVCTPKLIRDTLELADRLDTLVQQHNNEGHYEVEYALTQHGMRPAEWLAKIRGLSRRVIAAHSVLMSDREVEIFAEEGVNVAHCPRGNWGGLGRPKIMLMRRLKIPIGLGSDGAAGGSTDLFEAMKTLATCLNSQEGAPYDNRNVLTPDQILRMTTIEAAKAVGLEKEIGSLEVGKRADLLIIRPDLTILPISDPIVAIVQSVSGRQVETTIIDGKIVMLKRHLTTIDEESLRKELVSVVPQMQEEFLASLT